MQLYKTIIVLSILTIQGCTLVKIAPSVKRQDNPQYFNFQDKVTITTWGAITANKVDFFPSSFQIKFDDKVAYIDPVEISTNEKADFIFITHSHPDHLSMNDIKRVLKPETKLVCSRSVEKKVKTLNCEIIPIKPYENVELPGMQCEAVPAYNNKKVFLWLKAHPKSKGNVGYVLTLKEGIRLYHAGDTENVQELSKIKDVDIALIPVGGDNLTMNIEEAAELSNTIQPKVVIPMHFELKKSAQLQQFEDLLNKDIEVKNMNNEYLN